MAPTTIRSILLALSLSLAAPVALAQSAQGPVYALRTASAPRARVRAVADIARLRPEGGRQALEGALDDRASNVRRAAAISLGQFGDPAAIPALNARLASDRDHNVRRAAQASVRALSTLPQRPAPAPQGAAFGMVIPAAAVAPSYAAVAPAYAAALPSTPVAQALPAHVDWSRVRVVVSIGTIHNRASGSAADTATVRDALHQTVQVTPEFALSPGALPPAAVARLRARTMRNYSLEGTLTSVQRTVTNGVVSVRAELAMVILAEPAHSIIGTINTAASAQEQSFAGAPDPTPRLVRTAIEVVARGAIQRMQQQFGTAAPRRRH